VIKYTIAIVEDEVDILDNLNSLLSHEGIYEVKAFSDPREAYESLKGNLPDVLVTDLSMPKMSGLELISSLRSYFPDLPVVILSAYVDFKHVVKALRLGATDILEKPYKEEQVLEIVAVAAELGRARKKVLELIKQTGDKQSAEILESMKKIQELMAIRVFGDDS